MKTKAAILATFMLVGGVGIAVSNDPIAREKMLASSDRPEDTKAILDLDKAFSKAYSLGDAKALGDLFTANAEISEEGGATIRGREAIALHFAVILEADPKSTIELTTDSIRFLGQDAAKATGHSVSRSGKGGSTEIARYTVLLVKKEGRWLQDSVEESSEKNPSAHERLVELEWLLGDWVDESPEAVVHTTCRWSDDKNFLIRDFTMHVSGMPISGGSQRIGWDAGRDQFVSWVFDSDGGHSQGFWTRSARDQWTIRAAGVLADGRSVAATQILTFVNKGMARWRSIDRTIGGQPVADLAEIVFVRTPPKAGAAIKLNK